jgi:hypothetical protein
MLRTYGRGENKLMRFEKCAQDDSTAYFATSESYEPKFIMKSIAGVNDEKKTFFSSSLKLWKNKPEWSSIFQTTLKCKTMLKIKHKHSGLFNWSFHWR